MKWTLLGGSWSEGIDTCVPGLAIIVVKVHRDWKRLKPRGGEKTPIPYPQQYRVHAVVSDKQAKLIRRERVTRAAPGMNAARISLHVRVTQLAGVDCSVVASRTFHKTAVHDD